MNLNRSTLLRLGAGMSVLGLPLPAMAASGASIHGEPEQKSIKVGIAVPDVAYLPLYVAAAQNLWTKEGLEVELVTFGGDAPVSQALAGGSVDINAASMIGLFNLVQAGQAVKAIYLLASQAVFSFVGAANVKKWSDIKGGTFGVASYGSVTAALATVALEQHGLVVNRDVQLVQTGGSPNAYAALQAGRLSASGFSLPYALQAKGAGLNILGTQEQVTGPQWPVEAMYAKDDYLRKNPKTVSALLRGILAADQIIVSRPADAIKALQDTMKLEPEIAAGAYNVVKGTFLPKGQFPSDLSKFWKVVIAAKTVTAPLPMNTWYDGTWVDNYSSWSTR